MLVKEVVETGTQAALVKTGKRVQRGHVAFKEGQRYQHGPFGIFYEGTGECCGCGPKDEARFDADLYPVRFERETGTPLPVKQESE